MLSYLHGFIHVVLFFAFFTPVVVVVAVVTCIFYFYFLFTVINYSRFIVHGHV